METKELTKLGILTRCESSQDFERWLNEKSKIELNKNWLPAKRKAYRELLDECIRIQ